MHFLSEQWGSEFVSWPKFLFHGGRALNSPMARVPIVGCTPPGLPLPARTSTARVAPEVLERTWNSRVAAGAVWPPSLEVPPL